MQAENQTLLFCTWTHSILFETLILHHKVMVMEIFLFNMNIWSFQVGVIIKHYMVFANFLSIFFILCIDFSALSDKSYLFSLGRAFPAYLPPYWPCFIHYWEWPCHLFLSAHTVRHNFPFFECMLLFLRLSFRLGRITYTHT